MISDQSILQRAIKRYADECDRAGHNFQQPCEVLSTVNRSNVVLANVQGELRRYKLVRKERRFTLKEAS